MHGHTYRITVEVGGDLDAGMLLDYETIGEIVRPHVAILDHQVLNDFLENPTTELLAIHLADRIRVGISGAGFQLVSLEVDEGGHVARWTP
jgi:6-pyruvoyltetrahydropterin/6-carboxytetrahydropterin synthase